MRKLKFNKTIYKKKAIEQSMDVFSECLDCSLKETSQYFEVTIEKTPYFPAVDEFANYVLGVSKQCL